MSVKKNLVKATTTTAGTGTLILSPMTGWAPFSVYTLSDVVPYVIENGDNKEVGLGTVGYGDVLERTTVLATLVAGVYDDTSPVRINLSGNSTVSSGPLAELFAASEIAFTPAGGLSATDVQAALEELDSEKQPLATPLSALATVSMSADSLPYFTSDSGAATTLLTASGRALLDDGSASAQRTTLGLGALATKSTVATADIDAAAVTYAKIQNVSATDKLLGRVTAGAGVVEEIALTAAGRALIDDADAAAQRTTLGLGTAATADTGTSGHVVPYLDAINVFSANQQITGSDPGTLGPSLQLYHLSASPAAGDIIGQVNFYGKDSADNNTMYGNIAALIVDPTDASEDGRFGFYTVIAGAEAFRLYVGAGIYTPSATGGDKGIGTINASAVYDDNVLLTCYAIESYKTGAVTTAYWDSTALDLDVAAQPERVENRPVTRKVMRAQRVRDGARLVETLVEVDEPVYDLLPAVDAAGKPVKDAAGKPVFERVQRLEQVVAAPAQPARTEVRTHAPAARFAARAAELLDPKLYGDSWKATGHLPAMPSPAEWEAAGKKMSLGDIQQRIWETVEIMAIHSAKLLDRIEALEARVTALGG